MVETRAPGTEQISQQKKEEKWRFLKDALWGGGVPTGAGLVDGGVDQGPWLQERVGGGVAMAVPNKEKGWGSVPKKQVQGRGQGRVGLAVGGGCKGFGCGG